MDKTTSQWTWGFGDPNWHRATNGRGSTLNINVTYDVTERRERMVARLQRPEMGEVSCVVTFVKVTTSTPAILAEARALAERWAAPLVEGT